MSVLVTTSQYYVNSGKSLLEGVRTGNINIVSVLVTLCQCW